MTYYRKYFAAILLCLTTVSAGHADTQDTKISAVYRVEFGGISLGKFRFQSSQSGNAYTMKGSTRLRLLGGTAMDWKMNISSGGLVNPQGPQPETFGYNFQNKKKRKKVLNLAFAKGSDLPVKVEPALKHSKKRIPIKAEHFEGVYDPLTALMLLTHNRDARLSRNVCDRRVKLFDGKERYDIAFKYKKVKMSEIGEKKIKRAKSYVCSIRYIPVAGHKKNDKTKKYMAGVKGIEVWFTPFKKANLYVPHLIKIPTPFGTTTTIRAKSFHIQQNGKKSLRLIR